MGKYTFLLVVFLFIFGAISGWCLEVLFRKFFSENNPDHKWLNPGLTTGPWLPIYGFGTIILFVISMFSESLNLSPILFNIVLFFGAAFIMTLMELVGGLFLLKVMHLRLWDYRKNPGNYKGVICPQFFCIWGLVSVIYYYFLNDIVVRAVVNYFAKLDIFSFFVGLLWGIFLIDLWNALGISRAIKKYAKENDIVIEFETVKQETARQRKLQRQQKREKFFIAPKKDEILSIVEKHKDTVIKAVEEVKEDFEEVKEDLIEKEKVVKKKVAKTTAKVKKKINK